MGIMILDLQMRKLKIRAVGRLTFHGCAVPSWKNWDLNLRLIQARPGQDFFATKSFWKQGMS